VRKPRGIGPRIFYLRCVLVRAVHMIFDAHMQPSMQIGSVFKSVQHPPSTIHKMQLWTAIKTLAGEYDWSGRYPSTRCS
jgi:hypothetical protein